MIPWTVALLALFYAAVTAASGANLWRALSGDSARSPLLAACWLGVSAAAMCGLVLLKPWGRRLAVWGFAALTMVTIAGAGVLAARGRPGMALATTVGTGLYLVAIRYLQRPGVKRLFQGTQAPTEG